MTLRTLLAMAMALAATFSANAVEYKDVSLSGDGSELIIATADGSTFKAPRFEDQDTFDAPNVSPGGRYVGWLAQYPDRGATYSQPLYLMVMDRNRRVHRFFGGLGFVHRWCFWPRRNAVVYAYGFSHGQRSTWYELRRIDDERVLGRHEIPDESLGNTKALRTAPVWVRCIPGWNEQ